MAELRSRPLEERQADAVSDIAAIYQLEREWVRRLFSAYVGTAAGGIAACAEKWRNGSAQQQVSDWLVVAEAWRSRGWLHAAVAAAAAVVAAAAVHDATLAAACLCRAATSSSTAASPRKM